jgi:hypothetical protein
MAYSEAQSVDLSMSQLNDSVTLNLTGVKVEDLAHEDESASRLKAAFVYFNRRDLVNTESQYCTCF